MSDNKRVFLKFYCEGCGKHQPVVIEPLKFDDLNNDAWGDIVCKECSLVIATMSSNREGRLGYTSVFDIRELMRDGELWE